MDDKLKKIQDNLTESGNNDQVDSCKDCKKNPCVCTDKSEQRDTIKGDQSENKPPKISWIGL